MDVPPGHCWRCEKVLPQHCVRCSICPLAVYCSTSCRERNEARHDSHECQIFGQKMCNTCERTLETGGYNCASCNNAWYCNKECQLRDWPDHKRSCKELKGAIKSLTTILGGRYSSHSGPTMDFPYYFGNTMAEDFLKLDNNEWSAKDAVEEELTRDYHVLSAGCGDLRNSVLTAGSLPDRYQGKLHVTLNDFDPFVMARNVLFLFMLVRFAHTDSIASSLTTIWYSLHISKREYDLIKTSLDELIQMSAQQLHDVMQGLVCVKDADMKYLRQVWEGWKSLECRRAKRTSINLRKQRKCVFENSDMMKGLHLYLNRLTQKDKRLMTKWFDHALFLPQETHERNMPFDNPTLTGRDAAIRVSGQVTHVNLPENVHAPVAAYLHQAPKDHTFVYCIKPETFPFMVWDCLRVRESTPTPCSSPMVMYHNYVTNLLQKVKGLILQGRLLIHISLANCLDFPSHHQALQMPNYDRIFTSNLTDYLGFAKLLQTFKPLLNASNPFSTIVTETMNWFKLTPLADFAVLRDIPTHEPEFYICYEKYCSDTEYPKPLSEIGFNSMREYYYNTVHFLLFLRANIMGGGIGIPALTHVPSMDEVKKYHGMQMRDFRKELNRLVPFQHRVNARDLTMMTGADRAVEWCLPKSNN